MTERSAIALSIVRASAKALIREAIEQAKS